MWILSDKGNSFQQHADSALIQTTKVDAGEPDLSGAPASVIELNFASAADGRGFSLARRLRRLHENAIRLVATGHLIPDQARMAFQCGFDEIWLSDELVSRHGQQSWRTATASSANALYAGNKADRLATHGIWDMRHQDQVKIRSLTAREVFEELQIDPRGKVLDVRTAAELAFVGRVSAANCAHVEWKTFPAAAVNQDFVQQVLDAGVTKSCCVYLLCRSGVRSLDAAKALREAGFRELCNVSDGFEGDLNALNRRGGVNGWKASGLPWHQQ